MEGGVAFGALGRVGHVPFEALFGCLSGVTSLLKPHQIFQESDFFVPSRARGCDRGSPTSSMNSTPEHLVDRIFMGVHVCRVLTGLCLHTLIAHGAGEIGMKFSSMGWFKHEEIVKTQSLREERSQRPASTTTMDPAGGIDRDRSVPVADLYRVSRIRTPDCTNVLSGGSRPEVAPARRFRRAQF